MRSKNTLDVEVVIYNIYLSQSEDALLGSNTTSLDHDKVLLDQTVMGEPAHGVDGLIGQVVIGGSIVLDKLKFITKWELFVNYVGIFLIRSLARFFSEPWKIIT